MTMTTVHPREMAALTAEFFARAGDDPEISERMAFANTTLHIHFEDGDETAGCTVWLDRTPISAEPAIVGQAEIELFGSPEVFMNLIAGKEAMAMAIVNGDVTYTGHVRKFLRIVPILRTFDFRMWRGRSSPEPELEAPPRIGER